MVAFVAWRTMLFRLSALSGRVPTAWMFQVGIDGIIPVEWFMRYGFYGKGWWVSCQVQSITLGQFYIFRLDLTENLSCNNSACYSLYQGSQVWNSQLHNFTSHKLTINYHRLHRMWQLLLYLVSYFDSTTSFAMDTECPTWEETFFDNCPPMWLN